MPTRHRAIAALIARSAVLVCAAASAAVGGCGGGTSGSLTTFAAPVCDPDAGPCGSSGVEVNGCASVKNGQLTCGFCAASPATPCSYCPSDEMCPSTPCGTACVAKTGTTTGGSTTGGSGGVPAGITCSSSATCSKASACPYGTGSCSYSACACATSCGTAGWYSTTDGQTFVYGTCGKIDQVNSAAMAVLKHCGCI